MATTPLVPRGWTPAMLDSLEGKVYVITGTTTGCGFEAARILLSKGAEVVMLNRSPEKAQAVIEGFKREFGDQAKVSNIKMDLAVLQSVRVAAGEVFNTCPKIDALICNAAIAQVATQKLTVDGFESQLGTNHHAHFLLCGLLFSRIVESRGRIVVVGSNGYKMGLKRIKFEDLNFDNNYVPMDSYCQSKLAQIMFGFELQRRCEAAGINVEVHVCHPGASRTELINKEARCCDKYLWACLSKCIAQSAEEGAYPEIMCATQAGLKSRTYYGPTGRMELKGPVGECELQPQAVDTEAAGRLWTISEQATGLTWSPGNSP